MVTSALDRTIVALDNMQDAEIRSFLNRLQGRISWIKVGLEQYCRYGKPWVQELQQHYRLKLFLDLKFHDIPNTVAKAIEGLEGLKIDFLTIHLSGGLEMIKRAQEAAPHTHILGVSFLTSLSEDDLKDIFGFEPAELQARFGSLFQLAHQSSLAGIVCSPHEARLAKSVAPNALTICPGVRFLDEMQATQDQKRVADPAWAIQHGVDYLVLGRSLTQTNRLEERLAQLQSIIIPSFS